MSKAIYCDRCKKIFPETKIKNGKLVGFWSEELEFDFCENCITKVESYCYGDK